jgi:hypothetical protein
MPPYIQTSVFKVVHEFVLVFEAYPTQTDSDKKKPLQRKPTQFSMELPVVVAGYPFLMSEVHLDGESIHTLPIYGEFQERIPFPYDTDDSNSTETFESNNRESHASTNDNVPLNVPQPRIQSKVSLWKTVRKAIANFRRRSMMDEGYT